MAVLQHVSGGTAVSPVISSMAGGTPAPHENMIKAIRSSARIAIREFGRGVIAPAVIAAAKRPQGEELPVSVHLLVSSKTWKMGMLAAASLEYFSGRPWRLFIHEDGTVPAQGRQEIERRFPGVRFVPRAEGDAAAARLLEKYPACLRNRSRHNLFLKFFDTIALAPGERFMVLDSDLFFYRRPAFLLDWAESDEKTCWYNQDTKEVYCLPREQLEPALGVTFWPRFNSGLVCFCREAVDLALSERLLANFEDTAWHPQFFEQTLYALNASAFDHGGPLPPEYEISWNLLRQPNSVCRHYVGPFKFDNLYIEGPATLFARMTLPSLLFSASKRK